MRALELPVTDEPLMRVSAGAQPPPQVSRGRPLTIRRLLVRMLMMTQVPAILAIALLLGMDYQRQREDAAENTVERARHLAATLGGRVLTIQAALVKLADKVPSDSAGKEDLRQLMLQARDETGVDALVLVRPTGEQVLNTRYAPGEALPRSPGQMLKPVRTGQRSLNDLATSRSTHMPVVSVGVPVIRDTTILYALDAILDAGQFRDMLEREDLPPGWIAAVIDSRGVIVSRVPNHDWHVGKPVNASLQAKIDAGGEGVFDTVTLDGTPVVTAYRKSADTGWTTVVSVPRATLEAPVWRSAGYLAAAFLLVISLTLWGAMRLRGRIAGAIDRVRTAALDLPAGEVLQIEPSGIAEADELAAALMETSASARRAEDDLRRSQRRLHALLQTARSAIIVCDAEHRVVLFNGAAETTYGRRAVEVLGRSVRLLFDDDSWNSYLQEMASLEGSDGSGPAIVKSANGRGIRADGSPFPIDFAVSSVTDRGERFSTLIVKDVSELVRSREQLVQAHLEMQRVTQSFHNALIKEIDARQTQIARELHDAVGSSLAGTVLLLGSARGLARDVRLGGMLGTAYEHVFEAAEHLRRIARGVMPTGTETGLFIDALEQFAHDLSAPGALACSLNVHGDFSDVAPEVGTHLYRIIQEAAANAIRHGESTAIWLRLARCGNRCRLALIDNGKGCDLDRVLARHPGLGLKSMQARARAIGGELALRRRAYGGCRVEVSWQVPDSSDSAAA